MTTVTNSRPLLKLQVATRTDPKHCTCASAKPESVSVYPSTRSVDFVGSASERSVEIGSVSTSRQERSQDFVCSIRERSVEI
ncbi:hypothetical protein TNCV_4600471 [Trichonephila clavipes]|nr:hypothetical protein TNCV_4600471 [Trichonephila clavipes]